MGAGLSGRFQGLPGGAVFPVRRQRLPGQALQVAAVLRRFVSKTRTEMLHFYTTKPTYPWAKPCEGFVTLNHLGSCPLKLFGKGRAL